MTLRIALVQQREHALFDALLRLQGISTIEWKPIATSGPKLMRAAMRGCDAAFVLLDGESEFEQALQATGNELPPLIVDFSPVPVALFARKYQELARAGVELVGAQSAGLGTRRLYADTALRSRSAILAPLRLAAGEIHFTGACGTSKAMATIERLLFAVSCAASAEALSLAIHAGLDSSATRDLLAKGSGANEVLSARAECVPAEAMQAIDRGQDLARAHEHPLVLCAAASVFHQWQDVRA